MPSHKHKKKKKSHKRSKRHSSSSSEDTRSPWKVPTSDADSDESVNEERLTTLVRRTYMNYLKQALTLNLEDWSKSLNEPYSETIEELVDKWSSVLEQKAMRTCMISELYRTSMVSLIRQIKTSTNDRKLYIEEKNLSRLKLKIPLNKVTQTEHTELNHEIGTQTDLQLTSLLELPLPKSSPSNRPYDPAIDFSDSNSSYGGVSSSLGYEQPQSVSVTCGSQDVCNISSTSDLLGIAEKSTGEVGVKTIGTKNVVGRRDSIPLRSESNLSEMECSIEEHKLDNNTNRMNSSNEKFDSKKRITGEMFTFFFYLVVKDLI